MLLRIRQYSKFLIKTLLGLSIHNVEGKGEGRQLLDQGRIKWHGRTALPYHFILEFSKKIRSFLLEMYSQIYVKRRITDLWVPKSVKSKFEQANILLWSMNDLRIAVKL